MILKIEPEDGHLIEGGLPGYWEEVSKTQPVDGMLTVTNNALCARQNGEWVELKELTPEQADRLIKGMQGR